MTDTTITEANAADTSAATAPEGVVEEFVWLDPGTVQVGANVRTDLPDDKALRRSIKSRGVIEAITVYRDENGDYVLDRGQRRLLAAAAVGTPLIPARVVPKPAEADRIGDQLVENIHRTDMAEKEIVAGVEQLALLGVSAAQIVKRTAITRPTVNAVLSVAGKEASRSRLEAGELTLEEAVIFAEFEHDEAATARLERRKQWGHGLEHEAQRLRDEAAEQAAYDAEVERLREEGLPVLSAAEAEEAHDAIRVEWLRTAEGEPVPAEDWPSVPGAVVRITESWEYPEPDEDEDGQPEGAVEDPDEEDEYDEEPGYGAYVEPVKVYKQVWVVPDTADAEKAGLVLPKAVRGTRDDAEDAESEEQAEARRAERRRVIANNRAWTSAETVRREWLAGFLKRKTAPKGAEALICEAVLTGQTSLYKAMESNHPQLRSLLGVGADKSRWDSHDEVAALAAKATAPKAAVQTVLGAVIAAWEDSIGKHTWRNPTKWDARVLGALVEWGYEASEVEEILLDKTPDPEAKSNDETETAA